MRYSRPIAPCYFRVFSPSEEKKEEPYKFQRYLLSEVTQRKFKIVTGEGIMFTVPAFIGAFGNLVDKGGSVESILFPPIMFIPEEFKELLVKRMVTKDLVDIFSENDYYLSLEAKIEQIKEDRWEVKDKEIAYTIRSEKRKRRSQLNVHLFATISKQFELTQPKVKRILKNIVEDIENPDKFGCNVKKALPLFWKNRRYINWYFAPGRPKKHFTIFDDIHIHVQDEHKPNERKKHAFIANERGIIAPFISAFGKWKEESTKIIWEAT